MSTPYEDILPCFLSPSPPFQPFETASHATQAGLRFAVKDDLEFRSFCLYCPSVEMTDVLTPPVLSNAGGGVQSFGHARPEPYPLSYAER